MAVPTWMPTGSPSVEKMLGSGEPSGATLPVLYLSPFRQSIRTASKASSYRSRMPVKDSPSSQE